MGPPLVFHARSFIGRCQRLARVGRKSVALLGMVARFLEARLGLVWGIALRFGKASAAWGRRARPWVPFFAYNSLLAILFPLLAAMFLWQVIILGRARRGLLQRLGMAPPLPLTTDYPGRGIWFHAVSVGEIIAALPVIKMVHDSAALPLMVSVTTTTGRQVAEKRLEGLAVRLFYFPFDFPLPVRSLLDALRPACLILVESEIWPNLLFLANASTIRIGVINGRISDKSFRVARILKPLYRWALGNIHALCMQSDTDRHRAVRLGADPERAAATGNVKFDELDTSTPSPLSRADFRLRPEDLVLLAGSTHEGEDEQVLEAYWQVRVYVPEARLIIAPRHLERVERLEELILVRGFTCLRRSRIGQEPASSLTEAGPVILVDTIGELASLYSLCSIAFVGGSLVRRGGQNILQPLAHGKPVLFGPHMHNFREISRMALQAGIGFQVKDPFELANTISSLWRDQPLRDQIARRALEFISANKGASSACANTVLELASVGGAK